LHVTPLRAAIIAATVTVCLQGLRIDLAAIYSSRGTSIVHLDFTGRSKLLFKPSWDIFALNPSPDGKYLAFGPVIYNSNAWDSCVP
jgi:hypothetical protein